MGYDSIQRPVYYITLQQSQVFHVLLVDYWKPPVEDWRRDQPYAYPIRVTDAQDALPNVPTFTDAGSATAPSFASDGAAVVPTFSEG